MYGKHRTAFILYHVFIEKGKIDVYVPFNATYTSSIFFLQIRKQNDVVYILFFVN